MKILWLAAYPSPHITREHPVPWVVTLARLVSQHPTVELTILSWNWDLKHPVEEFNHQGIHFIYLRTPLSRFDILTLYQTRIRRTAAYLRRHCHRYDLIHLHGSELQFQAATAGLPVPVLLSVQGLVSECVKVLPGVFSWRRLLWNLAGYYERKYLPQVPNFSCRTHWDTAQVARMCPGSRIFHNWEAIREAFFSAAAQPRLAPTGRPMLLFMGGTQLMKGYHETLVAFDLIRQTTDMRLVVAGAVNPDELAEARRRFPLQHAQPADIEYRGFQTAAQLAQLCREAVCLVHPSYLDNSPNSVCEAQVAGLPVVATNVGGVSSLIEDGRTGLFADLNPRSLADQVLRLHHNPALRAQLARQAMAVAHRRHNPETVLRRTVEIYEAICHRGLTPPAAVPTVAEASLDAITALPHESTA
ncbi:glycosyltransferase [Hymenobacter sp. BT683]|uniref:Glycosyltransferase n=1 Tax=Hymenobacter jeongseonensis TaxID=2791027 RepID=A0ABS0ID32_9BACT|nr:glycosyltransferase [Hymenobacter jeongseonensis]MBF9236257.1 glycosyltransferase [Hymenobacter jeongseonensis]